MSDEAVNRAVLNEVARRVLHDADAIVEVSEAGRFTAPQGIPTTEVIEPVRGITADGRSWAAVRKVVRRPRGGPSAVGVLPPGLGEQPSDRLYWRREIEVYTSDLLSAAPPSFRPPTCLLVEDDGGDRATLWLELVEDRAPPPWPLARYAQCAYQLGVFAGTYSTVPLEHPWLYRGGFAARPPLPDGVLDPAIWSDQVAGAVARDIPARIGDLWRRRPQFDEALAGVPRTLCHGDAIPDNLLARDADGTTAAIDWSFASDGCIGEDLGALTGGALFRRQLDLDALAAIEDEILVAYAGGLKAAGVAVDSNAILLAYRTALGLRDAALLLRMMAASIADPAQRAERERRVGEPFATTVRRNFRLLEQFLEWAAEAERLASR